MFFTLFFTTSEHEHLLISFVCSIVTHFLPPGSSMRATWSQECSALAVQIFFICFYLLLVLTLCICFCWLLGPNLFFFSSAFGANFLYLRQLAFQVPILESTRARETLGDLSLLKWGILIAQSWTLFVVQLNDCKNVLPLKLNFLRCLLEDTS